MALPSALTKTAPAATHPTAPATTVPPDLQTAIDAAAKAYQVPADLLAGIWRYEAGSTYPNPYVNSSGYGGLFGTRAWNAPTQQQANLAASILATGLQASKGNVAQALSYYNSGKLQGGYTSVPGQTTFGTVPVPSGGGHGGIVGGVEGAISGAAGAAANAIGGAKKATTASAIGGDILNGLGLGSVGKDIFYGIVVAGGGLMILTGVVLVAVDLGLSAHSAAKPATANSRTAVGAIKQRRAKTQARKIAKRNPDNITSREGTGPPKRVERTPNDPSVARSARARARAAKSRKEEPSTLFA